MERQQAGHNSEARELFGACRASSCLPAVRKECSKQYEALGETGGGGASEAPATTASSLGPTCGGAWKAGVERQKSGHLTEARDLFAACRQAACQPAVRKECAKLYDQLESDIPSVVAIVTDDAGEPRTDVEIKVDGHLLAPQLDGRSVPVDPGVHEFSFASKEGDVFGTQKIMVAEGQHHRLISAAVPGASAATAPVEHKKAAPPAAKRAAAASPTKVASASDPAAAAAQADDKDADDDSGPAATAVKQDSGSHIPVLSYLLAGVGVVGIGGYGALTYWGRKDNSMLSSCSPFCDQKSLDHVHKLYLGADISLGVGIASLGASYLVYALTHNSANKEETAAQQAYLFDVHPTSSGAVASVAGRF